MMKVENSKSGEILEERVGNTGWTGLPGMKAPALWSGDLQTELQWHDCWWKMMEWRWKWVRANYWKWMRAVPSVVVPSGKISTLNHCNHHKLWFTITKIHPPWPAWVSRPPPDLRDGRASRLGALPVNKDCLHEPGKKWIVSAPRQEKGTCWLCQISVCHAPRPSWLQCQGCIRKGPSCPRMSWKKWMSSQDNLNCVSVDQKIKTPVRCHDQHGSRVSEWQNHQAI